MLMVVCLGDDYVRRGFQIHNYSISAHSLLRRFWVEGVLCIAMDYWERYVSLLTVRTCVLHGPQTLS